MKQQQQKAARARRQRIPAFGEWNYAYAYGGAGDWPVTQYLDTAAGLQAGRLVMGMAIPIPPSPPPKAANKVVKWRESATSTLELDDDDEDEKKKKQQQQHVVVELGDHGGAAKKQGHQQQSPVLVAHAYKAMDQDLYHIPPHMLCHEPRKRLTRRGSLWMGCLGLNCIA